MIDNPLDLCYNSSIRKGDVFLEQLCTTIAELMPFAMYWTIGIAAVGFIGTITLAIIAFSRINKRRRKTRSRFNRRGW
jgi:hypothetical protein